MKLSYLTVHPGSAHAPSASTKDLKRATSANPESSLELGVALMGIVASTTIMARLARLVAANTARALVINPMIADMNETTSAIVSEHMRLVLAARVENSACAALFVLVKLAVEFFLAAFTQRLTFVQARCPPAWTKKHLGRLNRLLQRRVQVHFVDDIAQIELVTDRVFDFSKQHHHQFEGDTPFVLAHHDGIDHDALKKRRDDRGRSQTQGYEKHDVEVQNLQ